MLANFDLAGRTAIVTGGNGGIGRGVALGLVAAGASVVIAARSEKKTAAVVKEIRALGSQGLGIPCDVTRREEIRNISQDLLRGRV
jgi:2-deoxy-D-gluconate 3-dehydrogenase